MTGGFEALEYAAADGIARFMLNRSDAALALNQHLADEFSDQCRERAITAILGP